MKRISLILFAGVAFSQPQPMQPQPMQQPVQAPPPAQVEVEVPKEVKEYIELQKKLMVEEKKNELKKTKRKEKFEDLQNSLSTLQHQKSILLEKKSIELIERLPPVFYTIDTAGVVGSYAITKSGGIITRGHRVGTAKVKSVSVEEGILLEDGKVVYPADSSGVRIIFNELYQSAREITQAPPPPPPSVISPSNPPMQAPPIPPPPPPTR